MDCGLWTLRRSLCYFLTKKPKTNARSSASPLYATYTVPLTILRHVSVLMTWMVDWFCRGTLVYVRDFYIVLSKAPSFKDKILCIKKILILWGRMYAKNAWTWWTRKTCFDARSRWALVVIIVAASLAVGSDF